MAIKFSRRTETIKAYAFKVSGFVISSNYLCVCVRGSVCAYRQSAGAESVTDWQQQAHNSLRRGGKGAAVVVEVEV